MSFSFEVCSIHYELMAPIAKSEILDVIERNLREILPELQSVVINPQQSMKELGANSLDRADVVLQTMEALGVTFPLHELGGVENIQGLVDFLHQRILA
jgi:polyketide biosynthesis acyl carrier protein